MAYFEGICFANMGGGGGENCLQKMMKMGCLPRFWPLAI